MSSPWQTHLSAQLGAGVVAGPLFEAAAAETAGFGVSADKLLMDEVLLHPQTVVSSVLASTAGSVLAGGGLFLVGWLVSQLGGLNMLVSLGLGGLLAALQIGLQAFAPLLVLAAGMATVPFAVLMVLSGFLGVAPLWLLPAALVARGLRYGLLGLLLWRSGIRYRDWLNRSYHGLTLVLALGLLLLAVFGILLTYTQGGAPQ